MFFPAKCFFARNRGDSRRHAQQRGHPRRHWRRVKTAEAGKIHNKKELSEKYQNLLCILSYVSGRLHRLTAGVRTAFRRQYVQRVGVHQREILFYGHHHGL